jgi:hypothetical protein
VSLICRSVNIGQNNTWQNNIVQDRQNCTRERWRDDIFRNFTLLCYSWLQGRLFNFPPCWHTRLPINALPSHEKSKRKRERPPVHRKHYRTAAIRVFLFGSIFISLLMYYKTLFFSAFCWMLLLLLIDSKNVYICCWS